MKKREFYDDGHTIADMSYLSRQSNRPGSDTEKPGHNKSPVDAGPGKMYENPFTPQERRMYVFAALKASMLIAGTFIIGLGLAILIMIMAWT